MSASPTEGTDINQIEKVARAMAEQANDYDADVLQWECWVDSAEAAIAAWNTRASDAEITRLTEALRAAEEREKGFVEALIWCSGSADFNEGGQAREGWLKLCRPLIDAALKGPSHDA